MDRLRAQCTVRRAKQAAALAALAVPLAALVWDRQKSRAVLKEAMTEARELGRAPASHGIHTVLLVSSLPRQELGALRRVVLALLTAAGVDYAEARAAADVRTAARRCAAVLALDAPAAAECPPGAAHVPCDPARGVRPWLASLFTRRRAMAAVTSATLSAIRPLSTRSDS